MQAQQLPSDARPATRVTHPTTVGFPERLAPDDVTLIGRMAQGDGRSLEQFYVRWEHSVRAALFLRESDFQNAEDAVAEVFWHVWSGASRFGTASGSVEHWVLAITRATCVARCRREMQSLSLSYGRTSC